MLVWSTVTSRSSTDTGLGKGVDIGDRKNPPTVRRKKLRPQLQLSLPCRTSSLTQHTTHIHSNMASAYRNAGRLSDESGSDLSDAEMSDDNNLSSASDSDSEAGSSASGPSDTTKPTTPLLSLPTELRNRILCLTSRGVSHRQRHLLSDLCSLLPHTHRDTKLDTKSNNDYNASLNALADLHSCNYIFFLEARKHAQDLYLWLAGAPNGPTVKFSVSNVHTMAEVGFEGNVLRGGRGVVVFDKSFDGAFTNTGGNEVRGLVRELLKGVFCVPSRGVRGVKPFVDRVIGVYGLDGKVWIRVYEIREDEASPGNGTKLLEVGPRMVLNPITVLEGSFGGPVIYSNKEFVSGNQVRRERLQEKAGRYKERQGRREEAVMKRKSLGLDSGTVKVKGAMDNRVLFG